ncbi:MAG: HNH endonuclease [Candidatus Omnitrophica bacterium]|nr:HNH endonuclease [Candidatus Omnitrophota bacterium]
MAQKKDRRKYADRRSYLIEAVRRRRRRLRIKAVAYKGGKCELCGYSRCVDALEFHHLNGNSKEFGISSKGYTRSWSKVRDEINKCLLLCANCHRELHTKEAALSGNAKMKTG